MPAVVTPLSFLAAALALGYLAAHLPAAWLILGGVAAAVLLGGAASEPSAGPGIHEARLAALIVLAASSAMAWAAASGRGRGGGREPVTPSSSQAWLALTLVGLVSWAGLVEAPSSEALGSSPIWFLRGLTELARAAGVGSLFVWGASALLLVALWLLPRLDRVDARRPGPSPLLFAWFGVWLLPLIVAVSFPDPTPGGQPIQTLGSWFWNVLMGIGTPESSVAREMPGLLLLSLFLSLPVWGARLRSTAVPDGRSAAAGATGRVGRWYLWLALGLVPAKLLLHEAIGVGVWIDLPGVGVRF